MIYSVWKPGIGYDYYQTGEPVNYDPKPVHLAGRMGSELGVAPSAAAWLLPPDAQKVGSGPLPRGRVASTVPHGLALAGAGTEAPGGINAGTVFLAIGALLLWKGRKR